MASAHQLDTLILFVTSRCNSRCRTCFYWKELNRDDDLTFDEISTLSRSMPRFEELWLSGGEPFLREELLDIVSLFHHTNAVRSVNLPTNGLLPDRIAKVLESLAREAPELRLNVNIALDGLESTHDRLRGVPGGYRRALRCLEILQYLREHKPQLRVHVNSVLCRENLGEMLSLGYLIRDRFDIDGHYFQVVRGDPLEPALLAVQKDSLARLYTELRPLYRHYAAKIGTRKKGLTAKLREASYLGAMNLYHQIQRANLTESHPWPMPCTAGRNIVVLDSNGNVRACELRETLGNIRTRDADWRRFWESKARNDELEAIRHDGCWCTHVCFIHASLKADNKARWVNLPLAYLDQLNPRKTIPDGL